MVSKRDASTREKPPLTTQTWDQLGIIPKSSPTQDLRDVVSVAAAFRPNGNASNTINGIPRWPPDVSPGAVAFRNGREKKCMYSESDLKTDIPTTTAGVKLALSSREYR
eukprot:IDg12295t1